MQKVAHDSIKDDKWWNELSKSTANNEKNFRVDYRCINNVYVSV